MKVKFITIGTGKIVDKMICGAKQSAYFELFGTYSRTEQGAKAFQQKHGATYAFWQLEAVANAAADAVYIASPTACHYEQAKQMLLHGKHVLCEKPLCSNYAEAAELTALAKEKNLCLLEAMRPVFSPVYAWIVQNLHCVGKIRNAAFVFCQYSSRYDNFKRGIVENAFKPQLSNGALMDIGVYPLHVMLSLFGMPKAVKASAFVLRDSIDGCGTAVLEYADFLGTVLYSKISDSHLPCEIQGEDGVLQFSPIGTPTRAVLRLRNGYTETPNIQTTEYDIFYETDAFCNMVLNGARAEAYNQNTLNTLKVMDEIRRQCGIVFPADRI